MRFTIQTLNAAPRLKGFVLDILSNLVNKQVPALRFLLLTQITCSFLRPFFLLAACVSPGHLMLVVSACHSLCMTGLGCLLVQSKLARCLNAALHLPLGQHDDAVWSEVWHTA